MSRLTNTVVGLVSVGLAVAGGPAVSSLTAAAAPPSAQQTQQEPGLAAVLDPILAGSNFDGATVSLVVRDALTGESLYERAPEQRLNPASTAKLFTSAAAMDVLGPEYRFTTDVLATSRPRGGQLESDLYLRGGGDPTALVEDYRSLARQLSEAGVRTVHGELVADDTWFDDVPYAAAWAWDDEPYYYNAVTSALTVAPDTDYDSGTVIVETSPSSEGAAPEIALQPATGVLQIVNRATTGAPGSRNTLSVERRHASDTVMVTGSIPADDGGDQDWVTVPDPTTYAADVFARALAAEGIKLKGEIREGDTPSGAQELASDTSMTVQELLTPFLKLSNNMHAEALVKAMGAEQGGVGSWDAGLEVLTGYAEKRGVDVAGLRLADGSGLSRFDLVSADDLADLLLAVQDAEWFDAWHAALPIAGDPARLVGGTLRNRMRDTAAANNMHAKTGSMTSVSALAGYVSDADGRRLVFAMISNNYLASPRNAENAVGTALAGYSRR